MFPKELHNHYDALWCDNKWQYQTSAKKAIEWQQPIDIFLLEECGEDQIIFNALLKFIVHCEEKGSTLCFQRDLFWYLVGF